MSMLKSLTCPSIIISFIHRPPNVIEKSSSSLLFYRSEIRFLRRQPNNLSLQLGFTCCEAIRPRKVELGVEPADSEFKELQCLDSSKTVRVKFQLQKECQFGDSLLLVGNHPILGSWDPSKAIPLNWSEGHVWSVELDIAVNKCIKFKFLLQTSSGELYWQPGHDRFFHSWDAKNTVVVNEDWEDAQAMTINEDPIVIRNDDLLDANESICLNEGKQQNPKATSHLAAVVVDKIGYTKHIPSEKKRTKAVASDKKGTKSSDKTKKTKTMSCKLQKKKSPAIEAHGRTDVDVESTVSKEDENSTLLVDEESPVLVPGLYTRISSSG